MDDNKAQRRSASYTLAVEDTAFLLRDELRAIRFALEYEKAELLLREWGVRSTVVVFGSARVPSPEQAEALLRSARDPAALVAARRRAAQSAWYRTARQFARIVSERGGALVGDHGPRSNVIATGGGPGVMEAANRGASDAGAPSIGFNITLPHEQEPNAFSTPDLTFRFHYFAMRKMHLAMRASALAVFPGGFGTFDELFELLTLQQTGKAPAMPIVLFDRAFWRDVVNFDALVEHGMVGERDLGLLEIVDTAEQGWESLVRRGLQLPARDKGEGGT
ncbi:MAG: LOG family protein [Alphaproteobacteria bacterium]|nr:LOG family protein [Alphaproteobacteria bacterium]